MVVASTLAGLEVIELPPDSKRLQCLEANLPESAR